MKGISTTLILLIITQSFLTWNAKATSPLDVDIGLYHAVRQWAQAPKCTEIRLPTKLCPACKLKPFTGSGANLDFGGVNRFDIYNISLPDCQKEIERYLEENPCDELRTKAWNTYKTTTKQKQKESAYKTMIYFMYSVCETCCDCVPIGSRIEDYEERKKNRTLINIKRGNCAAHYIYDTCKIWPNAGLITNENGRGSKKNRPWCNDFRNWLNSPNSKGWLRNNNAKGLTWKMRKAMNELMRFSRCSERTQWENCVRMEKAQKRV